MGVKKRILFVDDEASILTALELSLCRERKRWEMVFVGSGDAALEHCAQEPFDVVVSDMRMPVMNGAQLLVRVMERFPGTARLMLTGDADPKVIAESGHAIQELIYKPCATTVLREAISRWLDSSLAARFP
jgi:DNA-binding NtrC family response regulator